jgi:hypothetical protein
MNLFPVSQAIETLQDERTLGVLVECLRATTHLPGEQAEVGVFRGGTAEVISRLMPEKRLHLFDTFAGQPEDDVHPRGLHKKGDFLTSLALVRKNLQGRNVVFHPGYFPDTTAGLEDLRFSFVHVDCDLYQGCKAAIVFFWPRMVPKGIMVFHDYRWKCCPGIEQAVHEAFTPEMVCCVAEITSCWVVK